MSPSLEQQFLDLLSSHQDKIYRLCKAYLYSPELTEDLYQEVMYNIWKSLPRFRKESSMATWVYRITVNTAVSYNRKEKRLKLPTQELPIQISSRPQEDALAEKQQQENQLNQLQTAIAQLPPQERLIIGLFLEDIAYKEIAGIIGATTNFVGVKINRIKSKLAKIINSES